jgi:glycerol-3-phosphate dehydrogenase (NAD(P)+)
VNNQQSVQFSHCSKGKNVNEHQTGTAAYSHVAMVGAGAWGTALALVAAEAGRKVTLWAREPDVVESITHRRENLRYLSGIALPASIRAISMLKDTAEADALFLTVPAQYLRHTLAELGPAALSRPIVVCAKGIERATGKLLTEVLVDAGAAMPAMLSGPSFAREVANRLPTAVTIAASGALAQRLQATLAHPSFRPYASDDLAGVALGGAAKNVYAIACGAVAGMGLGENARAALLARSFAELRRLAFAMGAKDETLMGLSGLGDLVLTATSTTSRNYSFGYSLGLGAPISELAQPGRPLAEGFETAPAIVARARSLGVELPIAEAVAEILAGTLSLAAALPRLMLRPYKVE